MFVLIFSPFTFSAEKRKYIKAFYYFSATIKIDGANFHNMHRHIVQPIETEKFLHQKQKLSFLPHSDKLCSSKTTTIFSYFFFILMTLFLKTNCIKSLIYYLLAAIGCLPSHFI